MTTLANHNILYCLSDLFFTLHGIPAHHIEGSTVRVIGKPTKRDDILGGYSD